MKYFLAPLFYLILCTVLLTLPGDEFPQESWFGDIYLDKWIHVGMFGLMVLVISWAIYKWKKVISKKTILYVALACIAYGIGMEFVQKYWVINRSFDMGDIAADTVGSIIGMIVSMRLYGKK